MLVLHALRQNGIKRIQTVLLSPKRTPPVLKIETRRFSALNDVDAENKSPRRGTPFKVSKGSGTPELWFIAVTANLLSNIVQDESFNSPHVLTPQAEASGEPTLRGRVDSPWKVGAHVSSYGGVENAVTNAASMGSVVQIRTSRNQTYYVFQGELFRALSQICQMGIAFSDS
jgi:hypothetical protein